MHQLETKPAGKASEPGSRDARVAPLKSADLFRYSREITIEHGDDVYRLRLTNQGKLILTK